MCRDTFVAPKFPTAAEKKAVPDVLGAIFADKGRPTMVAAASIRTDGGTQMRAGLDDATVFEYGQAMVAADGWGTFPPAIAYHDGAAYWLADGFHRVAAFLESFPDPKRTIPVDVRAGTRRDAVLHAAGANAEHGLRRTNADKRRSVETMLRDSEWAEWPDKDIAKACNVTREYVVRVRADIRPSLSSDRSQDTPRTVTRGGTTYTQNTANIGKPAAVLNTAPRTPKVDDGYDEVRVSQPIVYTYEEMRKIAGDHLARGIAARKPDDEAIEHPLDCYDDPEYEAEWHDPGTEPPDFAAMAKQDAETLERIQWPARMRDLWELQNWLKITKDEKVREYKKLIGRDVSAGFIGSLDYMIRNLEECMDTFQAEVEAKHVS